LRRWRVCMWEKKKNPRLDDQWIDCGCARVRTLIKGECAKRNIHLASVSYW
jgi:hypothetical protein